MPSFPLLSTYICPVLHGSVSAGPLHLILRCRLSTLYLVCPLLIVSSIMPNNSVSHSADVTKHAKFALHDFLHQVLLHFYPLIHFFVVDSLGPSNSGLMSRSHTC